jgi:hypothetical protein
VGHGKAGLEKLQMGSGAIMADTPLKPYPLNTTYHIFRPESGWPTLDQIPDDMKHMLRPMAETLAMLEGNAFFGHDDPHGNPWWYSYLPEAWVVFQNNGGITGWAGEAQFVKDAHHENAEVAEAYESWRLLKRMYHE